MKKVIIAFVLAVLLSMPFTAFAGDKSPGGQSITLSADYGESGS